MNLNEARNGYKNSETIVALKEMVTEDDFDMVAVEICN